MARVEPKTFNALAEELFNEIIYWDADNQAVPRRVSSSLEAKDRAAKILEAVGRFAGEVDKQTGASKAACRVVLELVRDATTVLADMMNEDIKRSLK